MTNLSLQLWLHIFTRCSPVLNSAHLRGLWGCWAEFWAVSYLWCCGCRSTLPGTPPAAVTGIKRRGLQIPKEIILTKQRWRTLFFFLNHLSIELDGEDVVGVAVVANLCALLEVINVHPPRHGQADHYHQTAGEQPLHYVHIRTLHWEGQKGSRGLNLKGMLQVRYSSHSVSVKIMWKIYFSQNMCICT